MIGYLPWLIGRSAVVTFAIVTWAYCVSTYSPFAFDMFVRPRLFTWLETFVDWHHAFAGAAYLIAVATLLPDLIGARAKEHRTARILAAGFVLVFFGVVIWLFGSPYIRLLSTTSRGPATAYVALAPLLWLAVLDLVAARSNLHDSKSGGGTMALAAILSAVVLWTFHFGYALIKDPGLRADGVAVTGGLWSLSFDLTAYAILFAIVFLATALARLSSRPGAVLFFLYWLLLAYGISQFFHRLVFPSLAFADRDALPIAVALGLTVSSTVWSMWLRSPAITSPALRVAGVPVTVIAALMAVDRVEHFDWDFLLQKSATLVEGLLVFALMKNVVDRRPSPHLAVWPVIALPAVSLAIMFAMIRGTPSADVVRDRYAVADPAFRLTADAFIARGYRDTTYATELLAASARSLQPLAEVPQIDLATTPPTPGSPRPHIFMFVVDGLRRDYLSPYNDKVTFTPSFGEWAKDAFVYENAFTKYGGTWLAMPSIWSGMPARRAWSRGGFDRINSLEKLIVQNEYQFVINDFSVEGHLRKDTKRTFTDPGIKSVDTDLCVNVASLASLITKDVPAFSFASPMNVYLLNASRSPIVNGFSSGYAENVRRVDRCFGEFIAHLRKTGIYDNSIIVVTSDHGESLGEGGNYGHQFFLFPEDIRVPLIMSIPSAMRTAWSTDTGRVAFSMDIVPTLYALLGYQVRDLGPYAGSPLVTKPDVDLPSRRRKPFVVMSSYGASYGVLRRNGRYLFISDLINYREYAFELFKPPLGEAVRVSDDLRSVNQALIRTHVPAIDEFFSSR